MNTLPNPPSPQHDYPQLAPRATARRSAWERVILWIAGILAVLLVVIVVGGVLLIRSDRFHAYLLRTAQEKASVALGSDVRIRDYTFGWVGTGPVVELQNVVVHGDGAHRAPPLVQADSIRVQVTISSFLQRSWYVNEFRLVHPVVRVTVDRAGHTNLPQAEKKQRSGGGPGVFDLGVRHLQIDRGEIYFNDIRSELTADVHELALASRFDSAQTKYSGTFSYRNGHVQLQNTNPLVHNLDARFAATPAAFTLENLTLTTPGSRLSASATLRNYSQPKVRAKYEAMVDAGELRRTTRNSSLPSGVVGLSGALDYDSATGRPFLVAAKVDGEVHSSALTVRYEQASTRVVGLGARYTMVNGNATVTGIHAGILGGKLSGSLAMRNLSGTTKSKLAVQVSGASVAEIQNLIAPATANRAALRGTVDLDADAAWGKTTSDLVAQVNLALRAAMQPAYRSGETPLTGVIHARYAAATESVSFTKSSLRMPKTSILLNGTVSETSSLQIRAESRELAELEQLAAGLQASASKPLGLHGQATLTAVVTGSTRAPNISGQFHSPNLQVRGTSWKLVRTDFSAAPTAVRLSSGQMIPASRGRINFELRTSLLDWAFTKSSAFQIQLTAESLDARDLARAAGVTTPVSGTLSADVKGRGTQLSPVGQGKIELTRAQIATEPFSSANVTFQGTGDSVTAKLQVRLTAGSATADIRYQPRQQAYDATLRAIGIKLEQLETVRTRNLQMTGVLNITASGRGTVQDPGLSALVEIPRLQIRDQVINGLRFQTEVTDHAAKLTFASEMLGTHAAGRGSIQLTGDYPADISFDTQAFPLQPLVAIYAPSQVPDLTGQTELHATLRGPLGKRDAVEAHVLIPSLTLNYKNLIQLAAAGPINADYANGVLDLKRSVIRGTGTELTFQANVPAAKEGFARLLLQGTVDLRLAELLSSDLTSGGTLRFDIDSFGARSDPNVQGQIRILNASFAQAGLPLGLRDGNGVLTLTRDRLDITKFEGKAGGGTVTARGGVVYRPDLYFDMALKANGVRVLYEQSIRTTLNSDLALTGKYNDSLLRGQVNVEQLSFTSSFDLMDMAGQFGGGAATPPPTGDFSESVRLQVAIQTPGGVNLTSRNLSLAGAANLQLRGTAAQPVLLGRINLSNGDLIFSGNRYLVQSGTIDFRNPSRTEPVVDISASTTIDQYDIQMHFWGPSDHLHTNYSSNPALPPADVINLIAFGKTSEAAAVNPAPPGTLGAESLLASQVSSQVTSRIEKLAGISQLSIDPVFGSGQQSPGARIALQQRVTSKIFVTFAADVTSTQQQAIKVEYKLNNKTSFTAVRNQNGGLSFETSFRKGW